MARLRATIELATSGLISGINRVLGASDRAAKSIRPLISKTFKFKDYLKAYQYIDENRETTMKVIINVQEK